MEKQLYDLLESLAYSDGELQTKTFTILVHEDDNGFNQYQIQRLNPDWCVDVSMAFDYDDNDCRIEGSKSVHVNDWAEDQDFDTFDVALCIDLLRKEGLK